MAATVGLDCPPDEDPMEFVTVEDESGDPSHEVGVFLEPGEKKVLKVTVGASEHEKVGDVYAFDIVTTEESNDKVYGAARMYVLVTA